MNETHQDRLYLIDNGVHTIFTAHCTDQLTECLTVDVLTLPVEREEADAPRQLRLIDSVP